MLLESLKLIIIISDDIYNNSISIYRLHLLIHNKAHEIYCLCRTGNNTEVNVLVKVKVAQLCLTLCDPMDYTVHGLTSPGQDTGVCSLSFLQGIFPTQGSNPELSHCRQILYHLSHKGSPRIQKWVAYPFLSRSSWPRNWTGSPALQADSLSIELSGKPINVLMSNQFLLLSYYSIFFYLKYFISLDRKATKLKAS